jgi:hypothetical protein
MNSAMRHPKLRILVTFHDIIPAMTDDRPAWRIEYGRIRKPAAAITGKASG